MIPKIIHYCWFGRNEKPKLAEKCIRSWKKYCPDYQIIEWNEDNYDISSAPLYVRQAYEQKKWAYATDYIRLQVVYEHGGIYMDTDVELKKPLAPLLDRNAYFGFEDGKNIATGLGFGAVQGFGMLKEMMEDYRDIPFVKEDGSFDKTPCPTRNTRIFLKYGLAQDDSEQVLGDNVLILPSIYLCPIHALEHTRRYSGKTISIHWFDGSWMTEFEHKNFKENARKMRLARPVNWLKQQLQRFIGEEQYEKLKRIIKGECDETEG